MKEYIIWIIKFYSEHAFTSAVKKAWEDFFECMWNVLEESQERIRIKELEEKKAMKEMEEREAEEGKDEA